MEIEQLKQAMAPFLPGLLGMNFLSADRGGVKAEMPVRDDLCTTPGVLHGGAIMAFADTLGAVGAFLNLPEGAGTTTVESKTNFFGRATTGTTIVGESLPMHLGRRTMVWETKVSGQDGRPVARVSQTQIVLPRQLSPQEQLASLFADGEVHAHQALLATLERSGGALYRNWAENERDAEIRAGLLEAAEREDRNAELLESLVKSRG